LNKNQTMFMRKPQQSQRFAHSPCAYCYQ
jgi:hypothetical protein